MSGKYLFKLNQSLLRLIVVVKLTIFWDLSKMEL